MWVVAATIYWIAVNCAGVFIALNNHNDIDHNGINRGRDGTNDGADENERVASLKRRSSGDATLLTEWTARCWKTRSVPSGCSSAQDRACHSQVCQKRRAGYIRLFTRAPKHTIYLPVTLDKLLRRDILVCKPSYHEPRRNAHHLPEGTIGRLVSAASALTVVPHLPVTVVGWLH